MASLFKVSLKNKSPEQIGVFVWFFVWFFMRFLQINARIGSYKGCNKTRVFR